MSGQGPPPPSFPPVYVIQRNEIWPTQVFVPGVWAALTSGQVAAEEPSLPPNSELWLNKLEMRSGDHDTDQ